MSLERKWNAFLEQISERRLEYSSPYLKLDVLLLYLDNFGLEVDDDGGEMLRLKVVGDELADEAGLADAAAANHEELLKTVVP